MKRDASFLVLVLGAALLAGGWLLVSGFFDAADEEDLGGGVVLEADGGGSGSGARRARSAEDSEVGGEEDPRPGAADVEGVEGAGAATIEELDPFGVPYAALVLTVRAPGGALLEGVRCSLHVDVAPGLAQSVRGELRHEAVTAGDPPTCRMDGIVAEDVYVLRLEHPDWRVSRVAPLQLVPGRVAVLDLGLERGASLVGRVTSTRDGAPISGAEVVVYDLGDPAEDLESSIEKRAVTGPDGTYAVEALGTGLKRVAVAAKGYGREAVDSILLGPGLEEKSLDVQLSAGLDISGRVVDREGRPLAGARVSGHSVNIAGPKRRIQIPPVLSGANGGFTLAGLPAGLYTLKAEKAGFRSGTVARRREEAGVSTVVTSGRSSLNARAGETGVEFVLEPAPRVSGRVVDDLTGRPVEAFTITLNSRPVLVTRRGLGGQRFVDPEGRFDFSAPALWQARTELHLFALAPGYAGGSVAIDPTSLGAEGVLEGLEIRIGRGGGLRVVVRDDEGRPVEGARVSAHARYGLGDEAESIVSVFRRRARLAGVPGGTGADGVATIDRLMPGTYTLRVEHPSFAVHEDDRDHRVAAGEVADAGEIVLGVGGRVGGTVRGRDGEVLEGARVTLEPKDPTNGESYAATTGVAGAYEFRHVRPGIYRLAVVEQGGVGVLDIGMLLGGQAGGSREILVADGDELTEDLALDR